MKEKDIIHTILQTQKTPIPTKYGKVYVPNGDDAFVFKNQGNEGHVYSVYANDAMVEKTHFDRSLLSRYLTPKQQAFSIGYKLFCSNFSDLLSMGHVDPVLCFLTLAMGKTGITSEFLEAFLQGLLFFNRNYGYSCSIAGGDTIASHQMMLSLYMVGHERTGTLFTRSGAQVGDKIFISGPIGNAAAGLYILQSRQHHISYLSKRLVLSHVCPRLDISTSSSLIHNGIKVTSMIDTSDDLWTSVNHIANSSHTGYNIDIESIPTSHILKHWCVENDLSIHDFTIYGGEDYRFVFTAHANYQEQIQSILPQSHVLGTICEVSDGQIWKLKDQIYVPNSKKRYQHS